MNQFFHSDFRIVFMSYHILHQFDEPWMAETRGTGAEHTGRLFKPLFCRHRERSACLSVVGRRRGLWLVATLSLLVAAASLLLALDARRRADDLRQRLTALERQR
jgi:hypothetical protein